MSYIKTAWKIKAKNLNKLCYKFEVDIPPPPKKKQKEPV